jgi:ComF family protein
MQYSEATRSCQPTSWAMVDHWTARLLHCLWPSVCVLCRRVGQPSLDLCVACAPDLPANGVACSRCAIPLTADAGASYVCGACLRRPPAFRAAFAPFRYDYPLDWLIHGLKYRREAACGRVLGVLFARSLLARQARSFPDVIIPTPLSTRRYRERGFNQAIELARPISAAIGVPWRADLVIRQRDTREQTGLRRKERRRNVRGAFALCKPLPARHVVILDDVVTTGSTAHELARILRRGGATTIELWAVARAGG